MKDFCKQCHVYYNDDVYCDECPQKNKKLKILILTEELYPKVLGGGTTFLNTFKKGLEENGVEYEILCPDEYNNSKNFFLRNFMNRMIYSSWHKEVIAYLELNDKWREFDLINVHEFVYSGSLALKLKKRFGIPIVVTSHGIYGEGLEKRKLPKFVINHCKKKEENLCRNADYIVGINRNVAEYYKKFNDKVTFIPNFIDTSMFNPVKHDGIKTIAWIGRLSREKNVGRIIDIAKDLPDRQFLIVGDGEEFDELMTYAPKNVSFTGRIVYNSIPKIHDKIDLLFNFCEIEPFGLNILEGMASGIPSITYDINEFHYFVGESGAGKVIPVEAVYMPSFFNTYLEEIEKDYNVYSKRAVETAKKYDYKIAVKKYIEVFKEAING